MHGLLQHHQGRVGAEEGREGEEQANVKQMDNVSSATVLQPMMNLMLNIADRMFCFLGDTPHLENYLYSTITLFDICSVLNAFPHFL